MASELKVDKIFNAGGDQDSGINLATNDTIKFDIATSTKATMASTGIVTIVGEGGSTTTNLQQGLAKALVQVVSGGGSLDDSFNISGITDDGTGVHTLAINNNMANDDYAVPSSTGGSNTFGTIDSYATGTYRTVQKDTSNQAVEDILTVNTVHGDLA